MEGGLMTHALGGVLVLGRILGLALTAPAWSLPALGWRIRLGLVLLLAAVVVPVVGPGLDAPAAAIPLARGAAIELAVGAGIGLALALVLAAARLAGEVIGVQAGLSPAAALDPGNPEAELTPMGHLHGLVALGVFVALDGPLRLADLLISSYTLVPAAGVALNAGMALELFARLDAALGLALRAAVPVVAAMVVAGLALNLVARAGSGLGLIGLTFPARWVLGLALAALGLATAAALYGRLWTDLPALVFPAGP
jgi:flagellar biosynthesis protein FliR